MHATLSAVGMSFVLTQSAATFHAVKVVGAGYLVWLGVRSLANAVRGRHEVTDSAPMTASDAVSSGCCFL